MTRKNTGPFWAFNELFFQRHQRLLIWLLNVPLVKIWFRWLLRIRRDIDCPLQTRITELGPNRLTFDRHLRRVNDRWVVFQTTDFRAHPKFGKRLYYAFRPIWWLIHFWDWLIADRFIPAWSYGFSTLTTYPDAGTGATTVDGNVQRAGVSEAFSTLRAGAGTGNSAVLASPMTKITSDLATDKYTEFRRLIFTFDTSALTAGATIPAASLFLWGIDRYSTFSTSPDIDIVASTPASNNALVNGDYSQLGTTSFASIVPGSWANGSYNVFTLDANGIANITKTGISRFGAQLSWDTDNAAPTWAANNKEAAYQVSSADTTGTTQDPKLVVTYTVGTAYTKTLTDSFAAVDSLVRKTKKVWTDVITAVDVTTKRLSRHLADTFAPAITFTTGFIRYALLVESFVVTDVLTKKLKRLFAEVISLVITFIPKRFLLLIESFALTDTLIRKAKKLLTEILSLHEFFSRITSWLTVSRSSDTSATEVSRASDTTINAVSRASTTDDWNEVSRN